MHASWTRLCLCGGAVSERRAEAPRFKQLDSQEARRGREETSISLRKDKRKDEDKDKDGGGEAPLS